MKKGSFVNVSFVDDFEMARLNKKYRGKDYTTDVLSFDLNEDMVGGGSYIGDIVINLDQAKRQAMDSGHALEKEISELVAHGMLHLLGVHHKGDE